MESPRNVKTIETFFLRAKDWQILLLLFVVPLLVEVNATPLRSWNDLNATTVLYLTVMSLYVLSFLAWFWSMGSFLSSIVDPALRLSTRFFRCALLYPLLYALVLFGFALPPSVFPAMAIILPLHLFAMFCLFYDMYFVSKNLALAETGKPASFYDFAGPFFLIWFYPIGIWFVQPRINRLFTQRSAATNFVRDSRADSR